MNERHSEPVRPLLPDEWFAEELVTIYADLPYRHGIPRSGTGLALYEELGINQPVTNQPTGWDGFDDYASTYWLQHRDWALRVDGNRSLTPPGGMWCNCAIGGNEVESWAP